MARRARHRPAVIGLGAALVVGLAVLAFKWLLITTAILAVPFGAWWLFDREKRLSGDHERRRQAAWDTMMLSGHHPPAPIDPEREARRAEEDGMPESAAFWRAQPTIERSDAELWKARLDYAERWEREQRRYGFQNRVASFKTG